MKLPNLEKSVISIEKLRNYCLNNEHPIGKHKAKVFKILLGIEKSDAEALKDLILEGIYENEAIETYKDVYGIRYFVDINVNKKNKSAIIRTLWIIKTRESFPRLTSCYIKTK